MVIGPLLVDSGPLIALFNAADRWHLPVLNWLQTHPEPRLVTTWLCAGEVFALLARRVANAAALDFVRWAQKGGIELDSPQPTSLADVSRIAERYADLPFDLADASIAEAAARRDIRQVLTIDGDFDVYRNGAGRPLTNVLRAAG